MAAIYKLLLAGCFSPGILSSFSQTSSGVKGNGGDMLQSGYVQLYSNDSLRLNTKLNAIIPRLITRNSRSLSPVINPLSFGINSTDLPTGSTIPFLKAAYEQWTSEAGGALAQEFVMQKRDQPAYVFALIQAAPRVRVKF